MSNIVSGMASAIGYINEDYHHHNGHGGRNYFNYGISDKDQMFVQSLDAGERTRDILGAIADSVVATEKVGAANSLATEKVGAANQLATEKVGAAAVITAEKIGAAAILATHNASHEQLLAIHTLAHANTLAVQLGFKDAALQLAECCCDIKKEVADVKATVLAVDAHRIRDDLHEARAEILAAKFAKGNGDK